MTLSKFSSRWDASGQIPNRAVADGFITRFGAIDDTEGGETSRTNITLKYHKKITKDRYITTQAYMSNYDFQLFSNFTFFLNDPINGDQIKQKEQRNLYGMESRLTQNYNLGSVEGKFRLAAGVRYDDINNIALFNTVNRKTLIQGLALGNINETNIFAYTDYTANYKKWQANIGVRRDQIYYLYENSLTTTYEITEKK